MHHFYEIKILSYYTTVKRATLAACHLQNTIQGQPKSKVKVKNLYFVGGAVASWLARSTPKRVLRVRALAGDIVLCSWARHFTLMVPLSTQVYKWVPANLMLGGNPAMD